MDYTPQQLRIIEEYSCNYAVKLKQLCDPLIARKNVPQSNYDDLYDDAVKVLLESVKSFDCKKSNFKTYLIGNIKRSFYDWTRDTNRGKRCNLLRDEKGGIVKDENGKAIKIFDVSFDESTEDGVDLKEKIIGETAIQINDEDNVKNYLLSLSNTERQIAELIIQGFQLPEIKKLLHISNIKFEKCLKNMRNFEKHKILKYTDDNFKEEITMSENCTNTLEKSKQKRLSIASIIKKINNYTIRFDHPLQRESEQWSNIMKGNLISDILQDNPIPALTFAEQVEDNVAIIWDLDGKQRCTVAYSFANDGFKISKNIRRYMISYQTIQKDINGKVILDENQKPKIEMMEFDIRGKKFSDLPEQLRDNFLDYSFDIVQYINCSNEDIAYHIARYNDGKQMNTQQKGIISIGEHFASLVKGIAAMPFFRELGSYTVKECSNGTLNRVVVESVMNIGFLDYWKSDLGKMCEFLKENATDETFENFEDMVERLTQVATDEAFEMFNSKDSVIWFGLFARFIKTENNDKKFIEFLAEFSQTLHNKKINGTSFDDICINKETGRQESNKDRLVLVKKMDKLTYLMNEYLHNDCAEDSNKTEINDKEAENNVIDKVEEVKKDENKELLNFVRENVDMSVDEEDIEFCKLMLNDLSVEVNNNSKLLEKQNKESIIALIMYSVKKDINLDENGWFADFFDRNADYFKDQRENYKYMVDDLNNYVAA